MSLALASWLGRGGSRKWNEDPAGARERELDTGVFGGVWRRERVLQSGGWDERWPINQDSEMASRFLAHGARLVCLPEMAGHYVPRDSLRALTRQYYRYGYYRARTFRRHPQSMRRSHLIAPALSVSLIAGVLAPRPLRRTARRACSPTCSAVVATAASRGRARAGAPTRALLLAVLPAMHFGWGFGTLAGMLRFGPPFAAFARLFGRSDARPPGAGDAEARPRPFASRRGRLTVRLAVYTDYEYCSDGVRRYGQRAFVVFLEALRPHVERLVLVGRFDPKPGSSHYPLHEDTELVGPARTMRASRSRWSVARSLFVSLVRFWRLLDEVDTVWVLGPYPHSVALALLTAAAPSAAGPRRAPGHAAVRAQSPARIGVGCTSAPTCSRPSGGCSRGATRWSSSDRSSSASTWTATPAGCSRRPSRWSPRDDLAEPPTRCSRVATTAAS